MKNTIKKLVSMCIVGSMCISALCGCGGAKTASIQEVQVWSHDSHSKVAMNQIIDEFNESKGKELGVKLVYTIREGDIQQAAEMGYASNQGPDFISQIGIEKHRTSGDIYAIDDLKGGKEWIEETYEPGTYDRAEFKGNDGKVYRLPFGAITFGLVYNKDMFKKYGIVDENGEPTPPKTYEEMREYAKRMTNPEEGDYGIILPMKWSSFPSTDIIQLMYSSTGMGHFNCLKGEYDYSGLKPILEMYCGMIEDNSVFPGGESLDNDMARAYFAERNIGMKLAGSYDVGVFNSQFKAKCDWGVAPYPVADENTRYKQYMVVGGGYAVSKKAVEKFGDEVCLEILKFLYGDALNKRLYEEGMGLPYNPEIVEGSKLAEGLTGWKEFAEMVSISTSGYDGTPVEITGQKNSAKVITEDVLTGNVSIDDAIADLNTRYNEGMKKYFENNTDKTLDSYIKTEWDISLD